MKVRFWGVRGSVAVSGARYAATGGNTSCIELEYDGHRLVLDGGTGLRALGEELGFAPCQLTVLFSHYHWDHIQGVPFFGPAYNPKSQVTFAGFPSTDGPGVRETLDIQMRPPTFPVGLSTLAGAHEFVDLTAGDDYHSGPFRVRSVQLPHPNGVVALRVEADGRSVVYATDTEHGLNGIDRRLVELADGTDLLIHDAQYRNEEYLGKSGPPRRGWGHSTFDEAVDAAVESGARKLALYHHDPARDDVGIDDIETASRQRFAGAFAAREGAELIL